MGTGTGNEEDTQEEDEYNGEIAESEYKVSLSSSTHESVNMEKGYPDRFVAVTTVNKSMDNTTVEKFHDSGQIRFAIMIDWGQRVRDHIRGTRGGV